MLRGRQAYAWLSRLAPALTGEHSLAELTERLPGDKRDMVESLVRRLAEQRFIVDARRSRPHGLTEAERRTYAEEIAFIGYVLDSPEWRFERVRLSHLVLTGEGPLLTALLAACAGSGWRRITAVCSDTAAMRGTADEARRDPGQQIHIVPFAGDPLPGAIAGDADVLLQVSTDIGTLVRTARACEAAGIPVGQVLVRPTEVWLDQVGRPSVTAVESGWHRLAALPAATPRHSGEDLLVGPLPEVVAAMPALACFSHLTGLDAASPDQKPGLTRVDLRNLDTVPHRFLPHPRAGTWTDLQAVTRTDAHAQTQTDSHAETRTDARAETRTNARAETRTDARAQIRTDTRARIRRARGPEAVSVLVESLAAAAALDAGEVLDRAAEAIDSRLGLIGTLDEEGLTQTPLPVCQARVSDPLGALPHWAPPPQVVGWGEDRRTARLRCLLAALATYGVLAADAGAGGEEVVWGVELPAGRPRAVPASALRLAGTGALRAPEGAGAGLSWAAAVAAGLRTHCEDLLAARLTGGTAGTPGGTWTNPRADLTADPVAGALARRLELAGEPLDVRDCTSVLGVPAHVLAVPGRPFLVSAAATAHDALHDGLERLLLLWQSRTELQSAYSGARPLWAPSGDPAQAVRVMTDALRAAGRVPVAVPLDGDPEASRLLPFVTQVVLLDD
ncbi:hypothetical protein [Sphaerisporangium dianthi]|uniref:Uncharacterized protein n=1 Tax=Sphaerisporangium dianthi TaxID=1436120 RepID=A0ABV9CMG1_9ACTN